MSFGRMVIDVLRPYAFRGKYRLLNSIAPAAGEVEATVFGAKMRLDLSDLIQRCAYLGTFEREETRRIAQALRPGMTFFDVGANFGYFTALASGRVGTNGRVYSYEPSLWAYAKLTAMVEANGWQHVNTRNAGLSDQPGAMDLYLGEPGNHTPTMVAHEQKVIGRAEVLTLDDEIARWGVHKIDLMKIDVEGFEPNVLRGGMRALSEGRIDRLLIEFNDAWLRQNGSSSIELGSWLEARGYRLVEIFDLNRIYARN